MAQKRTLDLDKILDQASELIKEKGLAATTLPALAKALGVRSQSLYHYVTGRKQLLSLVAAKEIRILHHELVNDLVGLSGKEALLRFADNTRNFILHDPALSAVLYHLNEYNEAAAINQEISRLFALGKKLKLKKYRVISFHALIGAVLGYIFLDKSTAFADESKEEANENYHKMILRLAQPMAAEQ